MHLKVSQIRMSESLDELASSRGVPILKHKIDTINTRQESSMIEFGQLMVLASNYFHYILKTWVERTNGKTCVKIVITTGLDFDRPLEPKNKNKSI